MPPSRERPRARSKIWFTFILVVAGSTATAVCATSAMATPHDLAGSRVPPAAKPHAVAPSVTNVGVPLVPVGKRAQVSPEARLATSPSRLHLVAHVRRLSTSRFSMVGITWSHATTPRGLMVDVRSRSHGVWGRWTALRPDGDGPSGHEAANERDGTEPVWVGRNATGVDVAVYSADGSAPSGLEVNLVNPGRSGYDASAVAAASASGAEQGRSAAPSASTSSAPTTASPSTTAPSTSTPTSTTATAVGNGGVLVMPHIITRRQWGADPRLTDPCWAPRITRTFKMVFVHHTAGSNNYTKAEAPAIVRGIYAFHTQSRGWCDIAYNFLVDKYGDIFEGRRGGMLVPVRGAHAGDYNYNTTGISLMGNFDTAYPTRAMKHSLVRLIAWRMGAAYHGAYGHAFVFNKWFKRISGHRDAMQTDCPGQHVYNWLPRLRRLVKAKLHGYRSPIEKAWLAVGGPASSLGTVHVLEHSAGLGRVTVFNGGRGYSYQNKPGRLLYDGPVLQRYVKVGQTASSLGFPTSFVWKVKGTHGKAARFQAGRIYWSPRSSVRVLRSGPVLRRYVSLGAARGRLGFPTSTTFTTKKGQRARFQHGVITYDAATKTTTVTYT